MDWFIKWMANNHVAAIILLILIAVSGFVTAPRIQQELFPNIEADNISIRVTYKGVGPRETKISLCIPLEKAVIDLVGIENVSCNAGQDSARLRLEITENHEPQIVLEEVRNAVDAVELPEDSKNLKVKLNYRRRRIMEIVLTAESEESSLFENALQIKEDMSQLEGVNYVTLKGNRKKEILIEVIPDALLTHGLTLTQVSELVKKAALDIPTGTIETKSSQIILKTSSKKKTLEEFSRIPISSSKQSRLVYLKDIAVLKEQLEERNGFSLFDGKQAVLFEVYQSEVHHVKTLARQIETFVANYNATHEKLQLDVWESRAAQFQSRYDLLLNSAWISLFLVFFTLTFFLEIRLAFWVALGIPISFLGALTILPYVGVTINMISMFAFILVMGIVVDDAIVLGENIYQHREKGKSLLDAAIDGCLEMKKPVIFAIITTVVSFAPLAFISGVMGQFLAPIALVVICVILVSLLESLLILPAHLALEKNRPIWWIFKPLDQIRIYCNSGMHKCVHGSFQKFLILTMQYRYTTIAVGLAFLIMCLGLVQGGLIKVEFFPNIESDVVSVNVELPKGSSAKKMLEIVNQIESTGKILSRELDEKQELGFKSLRHTYTNITSYIRGGTADSTYANLKFLFETDDKRSFSTIEFKRKWQKRIKGIPNIQSIRFHSRHGVSSSGLELQVSHQDEDTMLEVINDIKQTLGEFKGVNDINTSKKEGNVEYIFKLKKEAGQYGFNPRGFAQEIKNALEGIEILKLQRKLEEIPVRILFPEAYRKNIHFMEKLKLKGASGKDVPIREIAAISESTEPLSIERINQKDVIKITASIESSEGNQEAELSDSLEETLLPRLKNAYPGLSIIQKGGREQRGKSLGSLRVGLWIALLVIYSLLAILFQNFFQPLIVMVAIPFGIVGAILGHLIFGLSISILSLFGLIGLTGVVINDSLILMDAINRESIHQTDFFTAVVEGVKSRFRPIVLTSITTCAGLMPILLEPSRQAKYLVPMAISLGVGILFATLITLLLIPAFYLISKDVWALIKRTFQFLFSYFKTIYSN